MGWNGGRRWSSQRPGARCARGRALAAVSDDLCTPLTGLRLRAELVEDETLRTEINTEAASCGWGPRPGGGLRAILPFPRGQRNGRFSGR
jgi:signal transduction histidine kinase